MSRCFTFACSAEATDIVRWTFADGEQSEWNVCHACFMHYTTSPVNHAWLNEWKEQHD